MLATALAALLALPAAAQAAGLPALRLPNLARGADSEFPRPGQIVPVIAELEGWANGRQVRVRFSPGAVEGWVDGTQLVLRHSGGEPIRKPDLGTRESRHSSSRAESNEGAGRPSGASRGYQEEAAPVAPAAARDSRQKIGFSDRLLIEGWWRGAQVRLEAAESSVSGWAGGAQVSLELERDSVTGWANGAQVRLSRGGGFVEGWANRAQVRLEVSRDRISGWANGAQVQLALSSGMIEGWANGAQMRLQYAGELPLWTVLDALVLRLPAPVLQGAL